MNDDTRMNLAADDFTLFGLPQRFSLDPVALDARWRELQSKVHPDRFVAEGAAAQRTAMQWSVRINEAHQRLREPLARAAYLCELRGSPIDAENNTAMPTDFLMQQMAWREMLEDANGAPAVEALVDEVQAAQAALLDQVRMLLDESGDAPAAAGAVRALMFFTRFRQDIERRLDALGQ